MLDLRQAPEGTVAIITTTVTRYEISPVPETHPAFKHLRVTVELDFQSDGRGGDVRRRWAVVAGADILDASSADREDWGLIYGSSFRFESLPSAMAAAEWLALALAENLPRAENLPT